MSIIDTFDESEPLITPDKFLIKGNIADICIVTFSGKVLENVLKKYDCKQETNVSTANGIIPIYSIMNGGQKILFYMSLITSACAGAIMNEVSYVTGAKKFIVFGSCGSLDSALTDGKFIIPSESYRDEGFSYHYQKASDFIKITNAPKLIEFFTEKNLPFVTGKSWTTDAIYRETVNNVAKRKKDGCICVEMESSGLQSLCNFEGLDFYTFFFASDLVEGEAWENVNLGTEKEHKHQVNCFEIAYEFVKWLR